MTRKKPVTSREIARLIAQSAHDIKAVELKVLGLRKLSGFTDYFVIASGRSDRQVQAICDRIRETLEKRERRPLGIEGYQEGHWVLLDYGEVVAHIFYEPVRSFYALEKLWGDAPRINFRLR